MGSVFGKMFRLISFGESHGPGIGAVVEGCPAGLELDLEKIQEALNRRRPGQSALTTPRNEADRFEVLSGLAGDVTTGAPIALFIRNEDAKSDDYNHLQRTFRPSHADYTYEAKYGLRDHRGGGRSSARETAARVMGGAIALQLLQAKSKIQIETFVSRVGEVELAGWPETVDLSQEHEAVRLTRCPDPETAEAMRQAIEGARDAGDSLGGIVSCRVTGMFAGLGEPVYDRLDALLAHAMLSINASKGFEMGSGFAGTAMRGSAHNDAFYTDGSGRIRTRTNHSGGVQGGISNGEDLLFRVAFKPTSTILQQQDTITAEGEAVKLEGKGRHDPCVLPRAVPVVEAMTALVLADLYLQHRAARL